MILTPAPLETLSAFGLAFFGGVICGLCLSRYIKHIRNDALNAITPC
ncbi:MAG: hypothetical protein V4573_09535 [Pseudomonadota bacterium]